MTHKPVCEYCWAPVAPKLDRYKRLKGWPRYCPADVADCAKAAAKHKAWSNRRFPAPPGDIRKPLKGGCPAWLLAPRPAVEERVAA